jgi:ABC-type glutathione transport system ATPase component
LTFSSPAASGSPLVRVEGLRVSYGEGRGRRVAVDGVSFQIPARGTLGLVGESGSGKTTVGRALVHLVKADAGAFTYADVPLLDLAEKRFRPYRKRIQMVFQDPYSTLNPRLSIRSSLREALELGRPRESGTWEDRMADAMRLVGLEPEYLARYPHEFSGGQRQRIGIARALCVEPEFLICDEPVSSLDVSIQAQILNLLKDLQERFGLAYLFVSHDLRVVRHMSRRVAVMQSGRLVEEGDADAVFAAPQHPYTQALIRAIPGRRS